MHRRPLLSPALLLMALSCLRCQAFAPHSTLPTRCSDMQNTRPRRTADAPSIAKRPHNIHRPITPGASNTALHNGVIIDVDDNFFTIAFFSIGLFYSLGKAYNRYLLEEVAFEQRKMEARERRLDADPTLSELDLRREESGGWRSVYGRKFRGEGETLEAERAGERQRRRVAVLDREDEDEDEEDEFAMSDDEIADFENRYGVEYDPYYDEPYEEDELPVGKYKEDKSYGDRRYENGEVFYKDEGTGLFYRQGSRPRQKKFWDLNSS
ncbi:hypothetical protein ACHAXT_002726 [Thalassiosira profunda]